MAKSLLILMLVATQLLAGSGGSLYLCISGDGSYCCLDSGPGSCTCCHEQDDDPQACASDCHEVTCSCHDRHETPAEPTVEIAKEGCGCIHIPLIVSAEQPTRVVRTATTTDAERLTQLIASPPSLDIGRAISVASPSASWGGPPAVPQFALIALTVVSTIVIRC